MATLNVYLQISRPKERRKRQPRNKRPQHTLSQSFSSVTQSSSLSGSLNQTIGVANRGKTAILSSEKKYQLYLENDTNQVMLGPSATTVFNFDHVFRSSTSSSSREKNGGARDDSRMRDFVFKGTLNPIINHLFEGSNIAYVTIGTRRSGKTRTILGNDMGKHRGLIQRSLETLLNRTRSMAATTGQRLQIVVTGVFLKGDMVLDVFNSHDGEVKIVKIPESGEVSTIGCERITIESLHDILGLMHRIKLARAKPSATHLIFTVSLEQVELSSSSSSNTSGSKRRPVSSSSSPSSWPSQPYYVRRSVGRLNFVDIAPWDVHDKLQVPTSWFDSFAVPPKKTATSATGPSLSSSSSTGVRTFGSPSIPTQRVRTRVAKEISAFESFLVDYARASDSWRPNYRASKLTYLLRGVTNVVVMLVANPCPSQFRHTFSLLNFGQRLMRANRCGGALPNVLQQEEEEEEGEEVAEYLDDSGNDDEEGGPSRRNALDDGREGHSREDECSLSVASAEMLTMKGVEEERANQERSKLSDDDLEYAVNRLIHNGSADEHQQQREENLEEPLEDATPPSPIRLKNALPSSTPFSNNPKGDERKMRRGDSKTDRRRVGGTLGDAKGNDNSDDVVRKQRPSQKRGGHNDAGGAYDDAASNSSLRRNHTNAKRASASGGNDHDRHLSSSPSSHGGKRHEPRPQAAPMPFPSSSSSSSPSSRRFLREHKHRGGGGGGRRGSSSAKQRGGRGDESRYPSASNEVKGNEGRGGGREQLTLSGQVDEDEVMGRCEQAYSDLQESLRRLLAMYRPMSAAGLTPKIRQWHNSEKMGLASDVAKDAKRMLSFCREIAGGVKHLDSENQHLRRAIQERNLAVLDTEKKNQVIEKDLLKSELNFQHSIKNMVVLRDLLCGKVSTKPSGRVIGEEGNGAQMGPGSVQALSREMTEHIRMLYAEIEDQAIAKEKAQHEAEIYRQEYIKLRSVVSLHGYTRAHELNSSASATRRRFSAYNPFIPSSGEGSDAPHSVEGVSILGEGKPFSLMTAENAFQDGIAQQRHQGEEEHEEVADGKKSPFSPSRPAPIASAFGSGKGQQQQMVLRGLGSRDWDGVGLPVESGIRITPGHFFRSKQTFRRPISVEAYVRCAVKSSGSTNGVSSLNSPHRNRLSATSHHSSSSSSSSSSLPSTISTEISMTLFATDYGATSGYAIESGAYGNKVRIVSPNGQEDRITVGRNVEWHTIRIDALANGQVRYYYNGHCIAIHQDSSLKFGHLQFTPVGCDMEVRDIRATTPSAVHMYTSTVPFTSTAPSPAAMEDDEKLQ